jgi:glycine cleavage system aminomethyltransferase T
VSGQSDSEKRPGSSPQPKAEKTFVHHPLVPYDPEVALYLAGGPVLLPYEYTGWQDESMSYKETCYISHSLNPMPTFRVKGRDAVKFLSRVCINDFERFPVGTGKHAIMCDQEGFDLGDGVMLRLAEDEFVSYEMGANYIAYAFERGGWGAAGHTVGEVLSGTVFLYQIAGPRSLEVLEAASGDDLHDIAFMHHRPSTVAGKAVKVVRVGMAGSLAYELHGKAEDGLAVYNAVLAAGRDFGLRRLGFRAYLMNHTEDGFPQAFMHFPHPWLEDSDVLGYQTNIGELSRQGSVCRGSMGPELRPRYRNPVELGWANRISFAHDFVGKAALEREVAAPRRMMVTLVWNPEDVLDVYASKFRPGEPYLNLDTPNHCFTDGPRVSYWADQVLKDETMVGVSSGRIYSYYYRQMLSLCSIDVDCGALGTEVAVLWGEPGARQKRIRATVSRFPYLNENRNEGFDVNRIPRPRGGRGE